MVRQSLAYVKTYALHWGSSMGLLGWFAIILAYVKTYALHWGVKNRCYLIDGKTLHTSKRMHFIEEYNISHVVGLGNPCIRQNVCTSLRIFDQPSAGRQNRILAYVKTYALHWGMFVVSLTISPSSLHTSKRMHFIEESHCFCFAKQLTNLHTSKRMHFIEDWLDMWCLRIK